MRVLKVYKTLNLKRNIATFLDLKLGIGRGPVPKSVEPADLDRATRRAQDLQGRLQRQRKLVEARDTRLQRQREQIEVRDARVARLQQEITQLKAGAVSGGDGTVKTVEAAGNGNERPGMGLKPGDPHYRSWVGRPENYDLKAAMQATLLLSAGLRETHKLVDVGCGSLRAGRMFIPYLMPGNYYGIEPNQWVVEEGIANELGRSILDVKRPNFRYVDDFSADGFGVEFDFGLAQSVFSHTYPDMTLAGLKGIGGSLAPNGKLFANYVDREETTEDGSGWLYPGCTTFTWDRMTGILEEAGLVGRRINWIGMQWFIATRPEAEDEIDALARQLRRPPLIKTRE